MSIKLTEPRVHADSAAQIEILAGAYRWRSPQIRLDSGTRRQLVPNGIALPHGQRSNPRDTARAMSQENVEIIQRVLEHFAATGEPDWPLVGEAVEVHDHDIPDAGEYRGHQGVTRWLIDWTAAWAETAFEPEEFIDAAERVVVVGSQRVTGRESSIAVERQDAIVWTIRKGKIVRIDYYNRKQQALEAVGLSE